MFFSERSDFDEVNYKCSARVLTYSPDAKPRAMPSFLECCRGAKEEDRRSNKASPHRFTTVGIFYDFKWIDLLTI